MPRPLRHSFVRLAPVAAAAVVAVAARPAAAQDRVLFRWEGRVDREAALVMRGSRVSVPGGVFTGASPRDLDVRSSLPEADGVVRLRVDRGRGAVDVVEQPSAANGYTARVRVRDDQAGADDYRLTAYWQPTGGSVAGGRWGSWDDDRDDRRDERRREREARRRERDERRRDRDDRRRDDDRGWGWGRDGRDAGGSGVLRWSGRVDALEEIRIRGRRAESRTLSGEAAYDVRSRLVGSLPRDGYVRVRRADGRGQVAVVQQPSAANDYTAVLRVVDRQRGAGSYDIEVEW